MRGHVIVQSLHFTHFFVGGIVAHHHCHDDCSLEGGSGFNVERGRSGRCLVDCEWFGSSNFNVEWINQPPTYHIHKVRDYRWSAVVPGYLANY
jgi:hypothetical protein